MEFLGVALEVAVSGFWKIIVRVLFESNVRVF